jgi:hypothetical protein
MKKLLILAALLEELTGLILLVHPSILIRLLLASEIAGAGVLISRLAGISLIALGVACWPDRNTLRAFFGMLTYGLLATLYLVYIGAHTRAGILLWPAVAVHAVLSALLVRAWRNAPRAPKASTYENPAANRAKSDLQTHRS